MALAPEDESVSGLKREAEHIPVKNLTRKDKIPIEDIQLFFGISQEIPGINKRCESLFVQSLLCGPTFLQRRNSQGNA